MSELLKRYQKVLKAIEEKPVGYADKAFRNDDNTLNSYLYQSAMNKHSYDRDCLKLAIKKEEEAIMLGNARYLSAMHKRSEQKEDGIKAVGRVIEALAAQKQKWLDNPISVSDFDDEHESCNDQLKGLVEQDFLEENDVCDKFESDDPDMICKAEHLRAECMLDTLNEMELT